MIEIVVFRIEETVTTQGYTAVSAYTDPAAVMARMADIRKNLGPDLDPESTDRHIFTRQAPKAEWHWFTPRIDNQAPIPALHALITAQAEHLQKQATDLYTYAVFHSDGQRLNISRFYSEVAADLRNAVMGLEDIETLNKALLNKQGD